MKEMKTMSKIVACFLVVGIVGQISASEVCLTNLTWKLTPNAKIEGNLLIVDVAKDKPDKGGFGKTTVDLSAFSGKCYTARINASLENVSTPPHNWSGLKFQFHYIEQETGKEHWIDTTKNFRHHEFPMQTIRATDLNVGRKLGRVDLRLGLEETSGRAVFDLSTLVIEGQEAIFPVTNLNYRVSYPDSVMKRSPLRGVMLPVEPCTEDDFRTLHEWGATLARYQMVRRYSPRWQRKKREMEKCDLEGYDRWLEGKLDHLERDVLPWAAKYGIKIVVDLHSSPGERDNWNNDFAMFHNEKYANHFVECWRRIATRFKGRSEIYGFDLTNEPHQTQPALCDYWTLQKRAAEAVREIDSETTIIIESNLGDSARSFAYLCPLEMDNVIYEVHMYAPKSFTHQQLAWTGNLKACSYPDEEKGWNIDFIRRNFEPVRRFEKRHNAKIYVGEFSAISVADGAAQYISDCISVFEEYGWDWTYHAFREAKCWSVEHEPVDSKNQKQTYRPSDNNARRRALLDGFRRKP
jgi:hypothetical protein